MKIVCWREKATGKTGNGHAWPDEEAEQIASDARERYPYCAYWTKAVTEEEARQIKQKSDAAAKARLAEAVQRLRFMVNAVNN